MSFLSRYIDAVPLAIDWEPLCLSPQLTVGAAIALWRDYFRRAGQRPSKGCPAIGCGLVVDDKSLVGLLPDWRLAAALWTELGSLDTPLGDLCLPAPPVLYRDALPSFSVLVDALQASALALLPCWDDRQQNWGLLSMGNIVRQVDMTPIWQKLSLETVAMPDLILDGTATVQDLARHCGDRQVSALPLLRSSGLTRSGVLACPTIGDYLIEGTIHPTHIIQPHDSDPLPHCQHHQTYAHARRLLQKQTSDYLLVTRANGELHGWITPQQWRASLSPEALLTALEAEPPLPLLVHNLESRIVEQQLQLRQDHHLIQHLLARNPNITYLYDLEKRQICYLNYSLLTALGYECLETVHSPQQLTQYQYPLLPDRYFPLTRLQFLTPPEKLEFCFEVDDPVQITHYYVVEVSPFQQGEDGKTNQLLCIARNVSDRRRAEAALQSCDAQLQTLINTITDGIVIVNPAGIVVFANPAACQMFGITATQLLQRQLGLPMTPAAPTAINILLPDQTPGVGELKCTNIQWQGEDCALITIRDVTDREQVLDQLQASEARYRSLLETLPNLVWRLSATGEMEECNQRTLDYLGQKEATIFGNGWHQFIHPDELSWVVDQWQRGLASERFFQLEYRLRRADGVYHWQLLQLLPLPNDGGQETGWLASSTDVHSLKQAEILIRQQAQQEKILAGIGQRIRRSLNLEQILTNTVDEVRRTLEADRVLVYQVYENGTGAAIAESVAAEYQAVLAMEFPEEVFPLECYERYVKGYVYTLTDRDSGFVLDCLVEFLTALQVRAKVVVPIVFGEKLWGLLIAHQCAAPRAWKQNEVQLLQSLANQLAIAIQQSLLYERISEELQERTKAEQQLLSLTRLQQGILDGASYMIIAVDMNGVILTFNRTAETLLGYCAEELIQKSTPLIFHDPEEIQARACYLSETLHQTIDPHSLDVFVIPALQQGVYEDEWTFIAKNGDRLPVRLSVSAVRDEANQPMGFVGIASDLRQQKQIETERQTLDFVVKNSTELITITDLDQNVIFLNQAGQKLIGIENDAPINHTHFSDYLSPDFLNIWHREIIPQVLRAGAWEGELTLKHTQTGKDIPVTGSTFLLNDPDTHKPQNLVGIMHDITRIKNAEKRILDALEAEKALSELRSRFISMASHEFRTPLAIISSSTSILETYLDRLSEEKRQQHLQRIQGSVKHMTSLLDDVLTINRVEANRLNFSPEYQDLIAFCQTIRDELQISTLDHQILFIPGELPASLMAFFDPKILQQVLTNLLSNAIKYSPKQSNIKFYLQRDQVMAVFVVQDYGLGISPEDLPQLFESFYRGKNVGTIQGTGLGLAIVKKCVERHGGTIKVTSRVNQGSCFTVRLPLWPDDAQASPSLAIADGASM